MHSLWILTNFGPKITKRNIHTIHSFLWLWWMLISAWWHTQAHTDAPRAYFALPLSLSVILFRESSLISQWSSLLIMLLSVASAYLASCQNSSAGVLQLAFGGNSVYGPCAVRSRHITWYFCSFPPLLTKTSPPFRLWRYKKHFGSLCRIELFVCLFRSWVHSGSLLIYASRHCFSSPMNTNDHRASE